MSTSKPPSSSRPARPAAGRTARPPAKSAPRPAAAPLSEAEIDQLQDLLDRVPAPLEPLDVSMLDGYLCAVLLQPIPILPVQWLPFVTDIEGRELPARFNATALHDLVQRRHAELKTAIEDRQWFDPWVFEMDEEASPSETVFPWVAGFSLGADTFTALMGLPSADTLEPLATIYMHLNPDDLEDADALLAEIDTLEPPEDLSEAVEGLVRSCLQLADVSRPQRKPVAEVPRRIARRQQQGTTPPSGSRGPRR